MTKQDWQFAKDCCPSVILLAACFITELKPVIGILAFLSGTGLGMALIEYREALRKKLREASNVSR